MPEKLAGLNATTQQSQPQCGIELTVEEKLEVVKGYGIADLLYVIREFEENPGKYEPEVIKLIVQQLTDKGIMLMY